MDTNRHKWTEALV